MIQLMRYVSAVAAATLLLCGCGGNQSSDKTVRESVTYELGDKVTLNAEEFIINANESDLQDAEVTSSLMDDPNYDYLGFTREVKSSGKDYLEVGTYKVTVKYGGKTYNSKIVVEDTTPPTFVSAPQSIVVAAGDTTFDPVRRFRITDKDTFTVEMEGDYDLDEPGTYDVTIIATDASGNKSSISITMKVVDGQQVITSEDQVDEDFNDINEAAQIQENTTGSSESTGSDSSDEFIDIESSETEENTGSDTACSAGNVPAGSSYYYSFDEAYAAGTAWNQQAPGNYFFYLVGTDDCGQTIYVLSLGNDASAGAETTPDAGTTTPDTGITSPETSEDAGATPETSAEFSQDGTYSDGLTREAADQE